MKRVPGISEAEWSVMKVVWNRSPMLASEIIDALADDHGWRPKTVKTLITRLVNKGALGFERQGRAYLYFPKVRQTDCVSAVSESFLERVFNGTLKPMLAHFVSRKKLSAEEIKELKRILERGG